MPLSRTIRAPRTPGAAFHTPAKVTAAAPALGVLVEHRTERLVLLVRQSFPQGWGPVTTADHIGTDPIELARTALAEQTHLTADILSEVPTCDPDRRLVLASVSGRIEPPGHRVLAASWHSLATLQGFADATLDLANGWHSHAEFSTEPGLLPEWIRPLCDARLIDLTDADLDLVDALLDTTSTRAA